MQLNRRLPRVSTDQFSMVPRADIPRSTFTTTHTHKTTFQTGYLIPIYVDEVLPGDVHQGKLTIFARLHNLIFPLMDDLQLETFFFFVPYRLVWTNWQRMMGERDPDPDSSISYIIPIHTTPATGYAVASLQDYLGLPVTPQLTAGPTNHSALPLRAYNKIWNDWFRDQNLQDSVTVDTGDGPDTITNYVKLLRNKHHDYFTSALPWPLKGGVEVTTGLTGLAPVVGIAANHTLDPVDGAPPDASYNAVQDMSMGAWPGYLLANTANAIAIRMTGSGTGQEPYVYADLSTAAGMTINALRLAIQTQRLLERDARSGTRYTELLKSHFGVTPQDSRLQRPEYIGGGRSTIQTQAIPQTSATGLTGGTSPLGALGAQATVSDQHRFSCYAQEHGVILGLAHVTAAITYQQGIHRMWTRSTRYDFYWPVFAHLGEQPIQNKEIFVVGDSTQDTATFGYQERWAEYRHKPSRISGLFRSTSTGNIDEWHLAEQFGSLPVLNAAFITDKTPAVVTRALAAGANADNMQILFDSVFQVKMTRAMPMRSVPGMMDHF